LTFIEEIPRNLGQYYANEQYDMPASLQSFRPRAESQRWKVEILRSLVPGGGDLLEVGPATGEFAYAAREDGFRPTVIEMDPNCARFLRDVLGLNVVLTADPASHLEAEYDAICLWQAIEHIPEFWKLMEKSILHMRPGAVLVLSTPNPWSLQARWLGRFWAHLDAPRHLYLIPKDWMHAFAAKHGLKVVLSTTRDVGSTGLNYYGWLLAVRNALGRNKIDRWSERIAGRISATLRLWEEEEGVGCSYTIALRKE
jgi:2-polyprenyl-3-methyl-5-hydroxy-6-metoxy-1,4-benzoquinol methylase